MVKRKNLGHKLKNRKSLKVSSTLSMKKWSNWSKMKKASMKTNVNNLRLRKKLSLPMFYSSQKCGSRKHFKFLNCQLMSMFNTSFLKSLAPV